MYEIIRVLSTLSPFHEEAAGFRCLWDDQLHSLHALRAFVLPTHNAYGILKLFRSSRTLCILAASAPDESSCHISFTSSV